MGPATLVRAGQEVAAELGTTNPALRKWARRRGMLPSSSPGLPATFASGQADAVRAAWATRDTRPDPTRSSAGVERVDTRPDPLPDPTRPEERVDSVEGWREALAQAGAATRRAEGRADTAEARLAAALVEGEGLRKRAEEAERGMGAAQTRLEALRAVWWHWRVMLDALGPVARLWRRWPDAPAELVADRLLAGPKA